VKTPKIYKYNSLLASGYLSCYHSRYTLFQLQVQGLKGMNFLRSGILKSCLPVFLFLAGFLVFSGCSARVNGTLREGGAADLRLEASMGTRIAAFMRRLSGFSGARAGAPIPDAELITLSLAAAPGIEGASFRNTGPESFEGTIKVSRIGEFLAVSGGTGRNFITLEESESGGRSSGRLTVRLDFESAVEILPFFSEEIRDYLTATLAPVALGERQSKADYLKDVAFFFGRADGPVIAAEIAAARVNIAVDFPGPVTAAEGGTFTGRRAEFSVPLVDLLVLETPLRYEVRW
jgi:hypothetical protein